MRVQGGAQGTPRNHHSRPQEERAWGSACCWWTRPPLMASPLCSAWLSRSPSSRGGPCFLMTAVLGRPLSSHGVFVYAAQGARAPTSGRNMALGSDRVRGTGMGLVQLTG